MSGGHGKIETRLTHREHNDGISDLSLEPGFVHLLPETYSLIRSANLTIHPTVTCIILHGSRGLAGGYRTDSDIDLSLIVDTPPDQGMESRLQAVLQTTLRSWRGPVEPDLAVIFDIRNCGLKCFEQTRWKEQVCHSGGTDCFGLYKIQRGFSGLVSNAGIQVRRMYPCLKIWQRREKIFLT